MGACTTTEASEQLTELVGRTIARHHLERGLTHKPVAESPGVGNEAVSHMERGIVMPTVARLVELAELFECDAADLLTESSSRATDQAKYLGQLLTKLGGNDRAMVFEIVECLARRLARR